MHSLHLRLLLVTNYNYLIDRKYGCYFCNLANKISLELEWLCIIDNWCRHNHWNSERPKCLIVYFFIQVLCVKIILILFNLLPGRSNFNFFLHTLTLITIPFKYNILLYFLHYFNYFLLFLFFFLFTLNFLLILLFVLFFILLFIFLLLLFIFLILFAFFDILAFFCYFNNVILFIRIFKRCYFKLLVDILCVLAFSLFTLFVISLYFLN